MSQLTLIPQADSDPKKIGRQMEDLYRKSTLGLLDSVALGDLVGQVRASIVSTRGKVATGGKDAKGEGIKGWLAEFAPSVPLSTAYRYEALAENIRAEMKIGVKVPLAQIITGEVKTPKATKLLGKVSDFVAGKSARQILLEIGKPDAQVGGKRTKQKKLTPEEEQAEWIAAARDTAKDAANAIQTLEERWQLLDDVELTLMIEAAEKFVDAGKAWLKTPAPSRPALDAAKYLAAEEGKV